MILKIIYTGSLIIINKMERPYFEQFLH